MCTMRLTNMRRITHAACIGETYVINAAVAAPVVRATPPFTPSNIRSCDELSQRDADSASAAHLWRLNARRLPDFMFVRALHLAFHQDAIAVLKDQIFAVDVFFPDALLARDPEGPRTAKRKSYDGSSGHEPCLAVRMRADVLALAIVEIQKAAIGTQAQAFIRQL